MEVQDKLEKLKVTKYSRHRTRSNSDNLTGIGLFSHSPKFESDWINTFDNI